MTRYQAEHWRWVKTEREKMVGWQCEWNGCNRFWSDGHHVTYEHEGKEWVDDIVLLCRQHHDHAHSVPILGQLSFDYVTDNEIIRVYERIPSVGGWRWHYEQVSKKSVDAIYATAAQGSWTVDSPWTQEATEDLLEMLSWASRPAA